MVSMNRHALVTLAALATLAGCAQKKVARTTVGTAKVERRNITVDATATGAAEPMAIVEVKSEAGGRSGAKLTRVQRRPCQPEKTVRAEVAETAPGRAVAAAA